jgi:type I restriction enzyme M protein
MLDTETKRRIDTARDILVGKVPDPKSQVEQITIALIYKFMDDMDLGSEELGGERSFFKGEFEEYAWRRIFDPRMGGFEILNLYSEAIMKMNVNPNIPQLFRDIFKNAYLPYRDPETLKSFLKIINEFTYDHSERLGDAFEYLLSVLGSQGEAGQFRTPRHIIDFMVAIIDPKKDEVILDPACGTAGFLISSYKHIIKNNSTNYDPKTDTRMFETKDLSLSEIVINSKNYTGDKLTPDERNRLANNIKGYDISPDMVRLSLVNMYLHGLRAPHIYEYDTLTSEDNWNEYADVILANPPFMSPKGGIRPHKRFSISSNRSEVLFVDYIVEHLTPNGRTAVIVPEGIIFQSGTAYKNLRKMLVENYLVGVISLPAGVFQPYSGVKTSILWLDRILAKKTSEILFVKIENDGFDLGAQRRVIKQNDLPSAFKDILYYKKQMLIGNQIDYDLRTRLSLILKDTISKNGDFNLSGERYKTRITDNLIFPLVNLSNENIFNIESGGTPKSDDPGCWDGDIRWITLVDLPSKNFVTEIYDSERKITIKGLQTSSAKIIPTDSLIVSTRATIGRIGINKVELSTNQGFKNIIIKDRTRAKPEFVAYMVYMLKDKMIQLASGGTFKEISKTNLGTLQIPLPPLSIQNEIVEEIKSYQKIIDGARQVVENYKPRIDIDPEWPMVELGKVCKELTDGSHFSPPTTDIGFPYITVKNLKNGDIDFVSCKKISKEDYETLVKSGCKPEENDILFSKDGTVGKTALITSNVDFVVLSSLAILTPNTNNVLPEFLYQILSTDWFISKAIENKTGVAIRRIVLKTLKTILIPLPDLATQKKIVDIMNNEIKLINSSRSLIQIYEQKIKDRIAKVWEQPTN